MSLAAVADLLTCPACAAPLLLEGRTLRCPRRHSYDVAKQGYVNLLAGPQPAHADTPPMVAARSRFLDAGHYAPIAAAVATASANSRVILDAGAGPGYYLAQALQPDGVGIAADISVAAAKAAARRDPRVAAVVADTWRRLPVVDAGIDAVLAVFAPKNAAEFARVLRPGGLLVTVTPTERHLAEARESLGLLGVAAGKRDELDEAFAAGFARREATPVEYPLTLPAADVRDLVDMGPNAFHEHATPTADLTVTVSVDVMSYVRRDS